MIIEDYWDGKNWLKIKKDNYLIIYYLNDKLHRENKPAVISCYNDGSIERKVFWWNDQLHREDGPAMILYNDENNIKSEKYYHNGKLHRKDGPAVVIYYMDGLIKDKEYWFNNIKFDLEKMPFELPIDSEEKRLYLELKGYKL